MTILAVTKEDASGCTWACACRSNYRPLKSEVISVSLRWVYSALTYSLVGSVLSVSLGVQGKQVDGAHWGQQCLMDGEIIRVSKGFLMLFCFPQTSPLSCLCWVSVRCCCKSGCQWTQKGIKCWLVFALSCRSILVGEQVVIFLSVCGITLEVMEVTRKFSL